MEEVYVEQAQGFEKFHFPYCNPFLGPRTKKEKIQKNNIYIYIYIYIYIFERNKK
jgi:hypothetical protein